MPNALITGAGKRLGLAMSHALLDAGYDLELCVHRSREGAEAVRDKASALGRRVRIHVQDLSKTDELPRLAETIAQDTVALDVLIHNAGIFEEHAFADITHTQFRRMMDINLTAPFFLTQCCLPLLRNAAQPSVIHITDIAADRPVPGYAHYSVSKAGLQMLTRALAVELGPKIRVNSIAPGTVLFPEDFDADQRAAILKKIPLAREGSAKDIAAAALYLIEAGSYVSGHTLNVDGGRSARL